MVYQIYNSVTCLWRVIEEYRTHEFSLVMQMFRTNLAQVEIRGPLFAGLETGNWTRTN